MQKIDIVNKIATEEELKFNPKPVKLKAQSDGRLYYVSTENSKPKLFIENKSEWKTTELPSSIKPEDLNCLLFTHGKNGTALFCNDTLYFKQKSRWIELKVPAVRRGFTPNKILLSSNDIFLGFNMGERGGALVSYNLKKKEFFVTQKIPPVTDMCLDPLGVVWFTCSDTFMFDIGGSLRSFHSEKLLLHSDNYGAMQKNGDLVKKSSSNWDYSPTSFTALSFDERDQIYMGTSTLGVFKSERGKFIQVSECISGDPRNNSTVSEILPVNGYLLFIVHHRGVYYQRLETQCSLPDSKYLRRTIYDGAI